MRIKNTLDIETLWVSANLLAELTGQASITVAEAPRAPLAARSCKNHWNCRAFPVLRFACRLMGLPSPGPSRRVCVYATRIIREGELNSTDSGILPEDSPMKADLGVTFPPLIWGDRGG